MNKLKNKIVIVSILCSGAALADPQWTWDIPPAGVDQIGVNIHCTQHNPADFQRNVSPVDDYRAHGTATNIIIAPMYEGTVQVGTNFYRIDRGALIPAAGK